MNSYINTKDFLEAIECADTDIIADYGPFYGTECGYSRDRIKEIIASLPQQSVVQTESYMDTKRLCENIFEITCVAAHLLGSNEIAVEDSRDLFAAVLQAAAEFEHLSDPQSGDYLLEIEAYAEKRLVGKFSPEEVTK